VNHRIESFAKRGRGKISRDEVDQGEASKNLQLPNVACGLSLCYALKK
jgi:hypothetical protein